MALHVHGPDDMREGEYLMVDGNKYDVTIDDGHRSVADIAAPLFRRYAVPAVAFVVTNWVGGACGPQSIANAQSTSSITCRDGTVIHFRDDNPRSCPSCEKGRS